MRKRILPLALLTLVAAGTQAQTEVLTGVMRGKEYGVTYMLPKTELVITVKATKHTYTPGEFCKYAEQYLRLKNVQAEAQTYWTLDQVQTDVAGTPDKEKVYFVKLKDKSVAPLMELTEEGIVRSINMAYSGGQPAAKTEPATTASRKTDPRTFLTEEILMATSTAKMAELTAKEIYNIRESKNALLRGESDNMPQDGAQLKLMLEQLNRQEQLMTEMFAGEEKEETTTFALRITPEEMERQVVFRFSRKLGLVDKDDLAGEPAYLTIVNQNTLPPAVEEKKKKEPEGVAYNVPGKAQVTLTFDGKRLYNGEMSFTQFGSTEYLAPVLFNKNSVTKVLFDTATGGLLKVDRE